MATFGMGAELKIASPTLLGISFQHERNRQGDGLQRNWLILIECPPYTEIFSKRRKIYSVCVEEDMR